MQIVHDLPKIHRKIVSDVSSLNTPQTFDSSKQYLNHHNI